MRVHTCEENVFVIQLGLEWPCRENLLNLDPLLVRMSRLHVKIANLARELFEVVHPGREQFTFRHGISSKMFTHQIPVVVGNEDDSLVTFHNHYFVSGMRVSVKPIRFAEPLHII